MKIVLSIAGSDSSGGAGIQADIKSGFYHKVFMTTAITAVTVQNTLGVTDVVVLKPEFVVKQIKSVIYFSSPSFFMHTSIYPLWQLLTIKSGTYCARCFMVPATSP